jgi:hypothetical protein
MEIGGTSFDGYGKEHVRKDRISAARSLSSLRGGRQFSCVMLTGAFEVAKRDLTIHRG